MSDIALDEKLLPCPFCGANPHHGLTKVEYDQLHGDPFQRFRIWCPTCLVEKSGANRELATREWNRRTSPSQVAPQPQAGEAVAVGYVDPADTARKSSVGEPLRFWCSPVKTTCFSMPLYASPQPANPAQVTDAMVEAASAKYREIGARCNWQHSWPSEEAFHEIITAAIGASLVTDAQIEHMVQQFLRWKLPDDFNPDGGISFDPIMNLGTEHQSRREPVGTNLFDYQQAKAMVHHMLEGLSAAIGAGGQAGDDEAAKRLATWIGYSWDGLPDESAERRGFPEWAYNGIGHKNYQGGKEGLRRLAAELSTLSQPHPADERVVEALDEGLEILSSLMDNITRHGNYSPESTCMFIDQAGQAFRKARTILTQTEASDA